MSLINDALKQAHRKADKPAHAPVDGLAFRPAQSAPAPPRRVWLIPAVIGVACALVAIAAVSLHQARSANNGRTSSENLTANARGINPVAPVATKPPEHPASGPAEPAAASAPAPVVTNAPPAPVPAAPPVAAAPTSTAPTVVNAAPVAQPEPLRLQAIVFHPIRPSALISGKTVFVGERVQGMKVVSITRETATLAVNGRNLVLTLPE